MKVYFDLNGCSEHTSIALGCFDGIHKGHLKVIGQTKKKSLASCVFTFNVDPQNFFCHNKTQQIYSQQQKIKIFSQLGIDIVVFSPFEKIYKLNGYQFIDEVLIKKFNAKHISCGFNYHFGKNGLFNSENLKEICSLKNIPLEIASPVSLGEDVISSTKIRKLIKTGNIPCANNMLGRPFSFISKATLDKNNSLLFINRFSGSTVIPRCGKYKSLACINGEDIPTITEIFLKNDFYFAKTILAFSTTAFPFNDYIEVKLEAPFSSSHL